MLGGRHMGSPDDWTAAATPEEERERAIEAFHAEFGNVSGERHLVEFIASEERRTRQESPGISFPELVKRVAAAMRSRGLSGHDRDDE